MNQTELDHYQYRLPRHLIAQWPAAKRTDARLMVVDRRSNCLSHRHVRELPDLLTPDDCLVINDTRVVPARLVGFRTQTGGRWDGLFVEASDGGVWRVMGKTRGRLKPGETITLINARGQDDVQLEVGSRQPDGSWIVRPMSGEETFRLLDRVGRTPLPPYIRKGEMLPSDREHYQTVYARVPGAVAAPTAGLHFTHALICRLQAQGVRVCRLTLHVGPGTFRPIEAGRLEDHRMHAEWGSIAERSVEQIEACHRRGGRVVAVGTTSTRLLETAALDGTLKPFTGLTDLFIRPPFEFRVVDALLTNFHLPRSTLLVLVRTFGGDHLIQRAYEEAIRQQYRFYSYGDAMLIL
jgi:S-adenosylmethionine:tRNA ribosyltransferase-isomerase